MHVTYHTNSFIYARFIQSNVEKKEASQDYNNIIQTHKHDKHQGYQTNT